ncbi:hypothetical protein, partial [Sphingorhabdus sp.]|uniref:hypothetical protein n=1 Tax=Sphingorhabdus sp. TaxID=1902408 RepID=UPI003BAF78A0
MTKVGRPDLRANGHIRIEPKLAVDATKDRLERGFRSWAAQTRKAPIRIGKLLKIACLAPDIVTGGSRWDLRHKSCSTLNSRFLGMIRSACSGSPETSQIAAEVS